MERMEKPRQSWAGLWNISFGFFGIQIGFALQNANMSRIFQSLGSSLDDLPALWIAAPLTGLLVQPIVGFLSDKTWLGRLGRRRPYFLAGAIMAALSLFIMPLSEVLLLAAVLLWVLDASLNVSMEPFRAFVGDMLRKDQHTAGYAVQTAFIGAGAVVGSIFPWLLEHLGVSNVAADGGIPDTVRWSFWFGGTALFLAVLWTVFTTREYDPAQMEAFGEEVSHPDGNSTMRALAAKGFGSAFMWFALGVLVMTSVAEFGLEKGVPAGRAADRIRGLERRGGGDGAPGFGHQHAEQHRGRLLRHADDHETAGRGAILQLVGPLHHVDQHDPGRGAELLRFGRRRQRRLPGGR